LPTTPPTPPMDSRGIPWRVPHLLITPHRLLFTQLPIPIPRPRLRPLHPPHPITQLPTPRIHHLHRVFTIFTAYSPSTTTTPSSHPTVAPPTFSYVPATLPFSPTIYPIQTLLPNPVSKLPTHRTSTLLPPVSYTFPTPTFPSPPMYSSTTTYPATFSGLPPSSIWDTPLPIPGTASPSPTRTTKLLFTAPSHRRPTFGVFP
jgi:hypothetical protein